MGTYWAGLSSPHAGSVVENSDLMIFAGAVLNDYTTVGWTALINCKTSIEMFPRKVVVCGKLYINVMLGDLLSALSAKAPKKEVTMTILFSGRMRDWVEMFQLESRKSLKYQNL